MTSKEKRLARKQPYDYAMACAKVAMRGEYPISGDFKRVLRKLCRDAAMEAQGPDGDIRQGNIKRVYANRLARRMVP